MPPVATKERAPVPQTRPRVHADRPAGFMKAIVKEKPKEGQPWPRGLHLVEKAVPKVLHPDDVKVEVIAAGICGTDVGIYNSKDSIRVEMAKLLQDSVTIGHEFCGRVVDAGEGARLYFARQLADRHWTGDDDPALLRLVQSRSPDAIAADSHLIDLLGQHFLLSAEMHQTCGHCYQCRRGERHVCQNTVIKGIHDDGAFARYMLTSGRNIILFEKDELPVEIIAFLDAFGNAVHTAQATRLEGRTVAVLGCGVQGLMSTAIARYCGAAKIFATDAANPEKGLTPEKLAKKRFTLAAKLGADCCFDVGTPQGHGEFVEAVKAETHGTGVDVVFEMSGSYNAYRDAFDVVRMGGTVALLGIPEGEWPLDFSKKVIFPGVTIQGIIGRRVFETWEVMRAMLKAGVAQQLLGCGFVSHQFPLEKFEEGFAVICSGDGLKVLLRPT